MICLEWNRTTGLSFNRSTALPLSYQANTHLMTARAVQINWERPQLVSKETLSQKLMIGLGPMTY